MAEIFKSGFATLIGAPNVGKSTLLNAILGEKISITAPKPQTTRNRITGILTSQGFQIVFLDTPGIHKAQDSFNQILVDTAIATLSEVDVICFVIDASEAHREINSSILEELRGIETPVILVLNKTDLVRNKPDILPIIAKYRELHDFRAVVPVSALTADGVQALTDEIVALLHEGPRYYPEEDLTDQPERFFVAELIREKIFHLTREEVPYAVAVAIDSFSEDSERGIIRIEATIHVERDSQKSIVIGKKGLMLKEIGTQARLDIEKLLGCRVHLGLFVRVQKNWRKDPRMLDELGYRSPGRS
ncbi:MAG: GTPase Era [Syntrophobacteraceae bacterium]